jgi:3-phosphoshikimate 1-carboxyvinyltransferase
LAIASSCCKDPIIIKDFECVSKSYPKFFDDFEKIGGIAIDWSEEKN